jgi:recombinational DNA repair ATPase RecF
MKIKKQIRKFKKIKKQLSDFLKQQPTLSFNASDREEADYADQLTHLRRQHDKQLKKILEYAHSN